MEIWCNFKGRMLSSVRLIEKIKNAMIIFTIQVFESIARGVPQGYDSEFLVEGLFHFDNPKMNGI
jgi:hypothetical protein